MQIHELNTKELTDPAWVSFDDGTNTYKAEFNDVVADAAAAAVAAADLTQNEVAFTSGDAASPTAWTNVSVLTSGSTLATLFNRISTMVKNVRFLYSRLHLQTYSVTPKTNASVSPFSAYVEKDISADISTYGTPIGIFVYGGGSTNPTLVKFNSNKTTFWVYAKTAGTATNVSVLYLKS